MRAKIIATIMNIVFIGGTLCVQASNIPNSEKENMPSLYEQVFNPNMGHRVFLSSLRGPIGILVEHPLDLLKTLQQTQPKMSARELASQLYKESGFFGFYKGVSTTLAMSAIKPAYRLPLIGILPNYFQSKGCYGVTPHIQTGLTIASIESCVISPLERVKVWLMTRKNLDDSYLNDPQIRKQLKKNALATIRGHKEKITQIRIRPPLNINYLFKGFQFQFATTTCAWTTFMATNYYTKKAFLHGDKRDLNLFELIASGVISGVAVTATALPADFLKTAVQKHQSEFKKTNDNNKKGITAATRKLIQKEGFGALYAGWRLKLIGYILRATTINVANYVIDNIIKAENS